MILITKKAQVSLIKKRDTYKCASCYERCKSKDLNVYRMEETSKTVYISVCDFCMEVITAHGLQDKDVPGYISLLKNKRFIDQMLRNPKKRPVWHKRTYGSKGG